MLLSGLEEAVSDVSPEKEKEKERERELHAS